MKMAPTGMKVESAPVTAILDAGPMGGFYPEKIDAEFFPEGTRKSILLVSLGYGDDSKLHPRNPRLDYEEIASFA